MKKLWLALAILAAAVVPLSAQAFGTKTGEIVTVPAGQTETGTYFVTGSKIVIDGTIDGDLVCAGSNITVNGTVKGDVLCAGQLVEIRGTVEGNVRVAGQVLNLEGNINRNVMAFGQTVTFKSGLAVAGDAGIFAQFAKLEGTIVRDVYGAMQDLTLAGATGSVSVVAEHFSLADTAKVTGSLTYSSATPSNVNRDNVSANVTYKKLDAHVNDQNPAAAGMLFRLYWMAASLLTALVLVAVMPHVVRRLTDGMLGQIGRSLGWGAVVALAAPFTLTLVGATVIGLPLVVLAGGFLAALFMLGPILAGTTLARWFLKQVGGRGDSLWLSTVLGVIVLSAVIWTPVLGAFVWLASAMWTIGGVFLAMARPKAEEAK